MERERKVGGRLVTTPPKSITSAFVCDISGVCCHCHMASQGSLDWFRAETVIQDCNRSPSTVPSRGLGLISSGTQPVTEVKGEQLSRVMGEIRHNCSAWFSHVCYWEVSLNLASFSLFFLNYVVWYFVFDVSSTTWSLGEFSVVECSDEVSHCLRNLHRQTLLSLKFWVCVLCHF